MILLNNILGNVYILIEICYWKDLLLLLTNLSHRLIYAVLKGAANPAYKEWSCSSFHSTFCKLLNIIWNLGGWDGSYIDFLIFYIYVKSQDLKEKTDCILFISKLYTCKPKEQWFCWMPFCFNFWSRIMG